MKKIGYILITAGFLAGALTAVTDITTVNWVYFLPALAAGFAGVIMVRLFDYRHKSSGKKLTGHLSDIETSLTKIVKNINRLNSEKDTPDTCRVRTKIDELLTEDLTAFIDARNAICRVYGLGEYADVMSYFASAERAVNRAWSASTDGYTNEVRSSLQKACDHFTTVLEKVNSLKTTLVTTGNQSTLQGRKCPPGKT